ncbi:MAG: hypothetical protein IJO51_02770 [Clostridia bacterium]|nr:hypothetical protein [Clostridia bacterium]
MKRSWTWLLIIAMLAALTAPVYADVLWEPDNAFHRNHRDECEVLDRRYLVNSPEGFVTVWDSPNGSLVQGQFENGTKLHVYYLYENWGIITWYGEDYNVEGWVDMDEMTLLYDHTAFAEDYKDQIKPYNGEFADYKGTDKVFNFYEYPGAPEISHWLKATTKMVPELTGIYDDGESVIQSVFVDENGLTWGYLGYYYGRLNAWFCLDDPDGVNDEKQTDFPLREVEYENLYAAKAPVMPGKAYLPYGLVGGIVAATGGLLTLFFKKKKRG